MSKDMYRQTEEFNSVEPPSLYPSAPLPPPKYSETEMETETKPEIQPPPITQQPVILMQNTAPILGPRPTMITCPSCHEKSISRIEYTNTSKTHLIAVILCVTTCCCCIPYCINSCKGTSHYCTHCGSYLGVYAN